MLDTALTVFRRAGSHDKMGTPSLFRMVARADAAIALSRMLRMYCIPVRLSTTDKVLAVSSLNLFLF